MSRSRSDKSDSMLSALGKRSEAPPISWLMSQALKQPNLISLAAGFTDNKTLPVAETREILNQLLASPSKAQSALQYGTAAGDERLREATASRLARLDSEPRENYSADNLIITNGSQQFLYMLTEALCDPGDIIIVEDPTYFVYLSIMQSHGIEARGVRMEPSGLSIESLEQTLKSLEKSGDLHRVKFLYSVTYFQNPTGITTSYEKKIKALKMLRTFEKKAGHPIYYVEDAAYRELSFPEFSPPASALKQREHRDRLIYTSTYSKPYATGVRVGFGFLPRPLHTVVMRIKGNHDFGTAHLLQQILVAAIESNKYETHLAKIGRSYHRKGTAMLRAIQQYFPENVQIIPPNGGLCIWATLPQRIKTGPKSAFFKESVQQGVLFVPGEFAFANDPTRSKPRSSMRLSYGSGTKSQIQEGIKILGSLLHDRLSK
jgi:2-aminoadipate transaminase